MRLTSIKLAGFKSFVDPTHFHVPGQLVGVVGPNGCGKSNIIDAVRWVLGESRASELRGESMQDVIFNGSTSRKPASRASVELIFDNGEQRAGGQWGQYGEIAVKRVLTRDGTSSYHINNLPARRRDIQDIFLGTGLGPRAYAIIGQGMIARIIEARPEELRVFLEEAAGVSKYKERRRETENRLSDTRENLTRVGDIVRELTSNLEKLETQAAVAEKFRALQADGEEKQRLLWLVRRNEAQAEQDRQRRAIDEAQRDLEAQIAALREVEADLETLRVAHYAASDALQTAQGGLYEANSDVARLEAEIRFVIDSRNRAQAQLASLLTQDEQWRRRATDARAELADADEAFAMSNEQAELAREEAATREEALPAREASLRDAQQQLSVERASIAQIEQTLKLEAAQQRHAAQQIGQLEQRRERLTDEARGLDAPDDVALENLRAELAEQEALLEEARAQLQDAEAQAPVADEVRRAAEQRVRAESDKIAQIDARLNALRQMQERVQAEGKVQPWLKAQELDGLPRLWKKLHIEAGWENALESVLRERLAALEISQLDWVAAWAAHAPPAKLAFYTPPLAARPIATPVGLRPLVALLRIDDPGVRAVLSDWLAGVFCADDLGVALAQRAQLPDGACFVVPSGHVVTRVGVQLYAADSEQAGLLARAQEIENLSRESRAQNLLSEEARNAAARAEAAFRQATEALAEAGRRSDAATRRVHALQLEVMRLTQAAERYQARARQIGDELSEIDAQIEEQRALASEAEAAFERLDADLAEAQARFEDQQSSTETLGAALDEARRLAREAGLSAQEASYRAREQSQKIERLQQLIESSGGEIARLEIELEATRAELASIDEQTADTGLQQALTVRAEREALLGAARRELDELAARLRQADEGRLVAERSLNPLRERITELQLKEQAARLNRDQFAEQLEAAAVDIEALLPKLSADLKPSWLQGEVTRINQSIDALGAVNLAALDELTVARERKQFLDAQTADLQDAIDTLEDAIRKIDQETRRLLQGTFDEVNRHFGELFPSLFGGGQAKLTMTGEEILDAGVLIMAQPPGKKNSTIHLLSGGEKALAATALVFAMFRLNPAPFCLLDEVDAPLDDANTERFANLVRKMAEKTQFLFISHNKIAMEMAQQLIGVTMQEQGVSRIVAVDMETAAGFVQSAA
ncbi:MAG: chromosome segregation protein SMC [Janthinobacterium lividum]